MHVPYLGIVKMGTATWMCTVPEGTDNPPMWTITDKDGNRLLQTQDGGKTYGYILTGTENSTEYIMIAQDGTDGIPGEPGKDGKVLYTWIRYADDAQGNGISDSPVGKKFLGLAHNKETSVESNDPRIISGVILKEKMVLVFREKTVRLTTLGSHTLITPTVAVCISSLMKIRNT